MGLLNVSSIERLILNKKSKRQIFAHSPATNASIEIFIAKI